MRSRRVDSNVIFALHLKTGLVGLQIISNYVGKPKPAFAACAMLNGRDEQHIYPTHMRILHAGVILVLYTPPNISP